MLKGSLIERRQFPRILTNGKMPGDLLHAESGKRVVCTSLDVSVMGLGISSGEEFLNGSELILETSEQRFRLRVVSLFRRAGSNEARYGLLSEENDQDLVACFRQAGCLKFESKDGGSLSVERQSDRAARFSIEQEIHVKIQTFGTRNNYDIILENVSRSGLLVAVASGDDLPFRVNTIVDMEIDPRRTVLKGSIHLTGKIVRRVDDPNARDPRGRKITRFGISVTEVHPGYEDPWREVLDSLACEIEVIDEES